MRIRQTQLTKSDVGKYVWCQFGWKREDGVFEWEPRVYQCSVQWTNSPYPGPIIGGSELTFFDPKTKWYSTRDPSVPGRGLRHFGIVYE